MEKEIYIDTQGKKIITAAGCFTVVICLLFFGLQYLRMSEQPKREYHNLSKPIEPVESYELTHEAAVILFEGNQQALDFVEQHKQ